MQYDLECEGVCKSFGALKAVDDVSFTIPSGSFFSILGPSGCGKTTLMRMIAGFEQPDRGDIRIKGQSVLAMPPNRRNVKMVFQHLALFPMMNVTENIAYGLRCAGESKAEIRRRVTDVLERVRLPEAADKEIHQLSGGQKQRIAIARCMVLDPDVLLLDEPLGALDLKLRESMKIELKQLQHQFGTTFVYITHDQSEALVMSDHVAVMNNGRFEQIGTPQQLYHHPESAFVAGFVGDANRWPGRVAGRAGGLLQVETDSGRMLVGQGVGGGEFADGADVHMFVRPEFIAIRRAGGGPAADDMNRIDGVIESLLFNGANSRLLVRIDDAQEVEVDIPMAGEAMDLRPGDQVSLTWTPDRGRVFMGAA